jgi:hypothetical protein
MIKPYLENFYGNQVVIRPPENNFFEKLFLRKVIFFRIKLFFDIL